MGTILTQSSMLTRGSLFCCFKKQAKVQGRLNSRIKFVPIRNGSLSSKLPSSLFMSGNKFTTATTAGLFGYPEFKTASQFAVETDKCIQRSKLLVKEIINMESFDVALIEKMDLLSDEICRVADLSECIRQVHPDERIAKAAENACLTINAFVEELNTNIELYAALDRFIKDSRFSSLDRSTRRTSKVFMHDFEASGIFLEESLRKKVVEVTKNLLEIGFRYVHNCLEPSMVKKELCTNDFKLYFEQYQGYYAVDRVLYYNKSRELRKKTYLLYYGDDPSKLEEVENLITKRQKLANLVGYPSFPHRVLQLSMAESPETVTNFLDCLSDKVMPLARQDVETLKEQADTIEIGPWDIPVLQKAVQDAASKQESRSIQNWFPLDACIAGLGNLFKGLFGVNLETASVKEGEVWHPFVLKFNFVDEDQNLLGCTYGDLIERGERHAADCHFTIRGGREQSFAFVDSESMVSTRHHGYQLPVITLCCSAEKPSEQSGPSLLSRRSVATLFHEMGHALHSMLGRAGYQNVTGTRCPTDFAEVPSTLMEFFLYDQRVILSFARHYESGAPLPSSLLNSFLVSDQMFPAYDIQVQIYHAFLDQKLHGTSSTQEVPGWSLQVFKETTEKYNPLGYIPQTSYYLRFPHLSGYGGRYYSYLWSRAVASLIWKSFFQDDPFSRENGEKYRSMLRHGGSASSRELVRDMLGFEPTVSDLVDTLYTDIVKKRERVKSLL